MKCASRTTVCLPDLIVGETAQWQITITDETNTPVNLTGVQEIEFRLTARDTVVASRVIGTGVQIVDALAGSVLVTLATATLQPWQYEAYLITTDAGGRVQMTKANLRLLPKPTSAS